jgi:lysophospholipase L1-like esterase
MVLQNELAEYADTSLSIKVYNAGKSGDASDDHVAMLVHRIVHLEPDMIIVFSGFNDLLRSIYDHDYLHYLKDNNIVKYPMFKLLATEFQIPRRIYYLWKRVYPTEREVLETITDRSNYKQKVALRKSAPVSNQNPKTNLKAYSNNLRTIIGVAMAHEIRLVFITQQTTWNSTVDPHAKDWHWLLYRGRARVTYREDLMDKAMESLNDVTRQLSNKNSIPIYDLAMTMPKSLDFFYDDVHFNVKGADIAGKQLASYILRQNLIPKYK